MFIHELILVIAVAVQQFRAKLSWIPVLDCWALLKGPC